MSQSKKTLVLGASENPMRYSNIAINRLRSNGHEVMAIGKKEGKVADIAITTAKEDVKDIDTVTLYLNPSHQRQYYDYILSLHPKRVIFNPGAENDELYDLAQTNGIQPVEACTLVMLSTGQF
jgi:predicted CoA-binding protein